MPSKPAGKRPTSQDVAELAGVSITTVSFVINHKSDGNVRISEGTRRKVWEAVKTLGYRPLTAARTLRTKRSNLLALMIPHIETPFQPQFAAAIQREAEKVNLDVIIYGTEDDLDREKYFLEMLIARGVDGVIIHSHQLTRDDLSPLIEAGVAVVIHGDSPSHPLADNVMLDEIQAVQEVITYLIEREHHRIGLISGPEGTWGGRLRKEGYLNGLRAHNIPVQGELIQEADFFIHNAGRIAMQKLLALSRPPTAVFAASDLLAVDALLYAVDSGLSIPADVAIVGFDNTREATRVRPKLTTVHKDVKALAAAAVQMLMKRINSKSRLPARRTIIEHEIIYRESA